MKKQVLIVVLSIISYVLCAQTRQEPFDTQWKFYKSDVPNGEAADLNDAGWRTVDLPHDWSIEDLPNQARNE